MKQDVFFIYPLLFTFSLLIGCNKSEGTTTTYSEALVTSLSFAKNDSFPGLAKASFTIVTSTDTGSIYNLDSLLYGTQLDSVVPRFTFNHTPALSILYCDTDTVIYSGADTVSMVKQPCRLFVLASDQKTAKWYDIRVNVHQVDPDLYTWECLTPSVYMSDGAESKAFLQDGTFYLLTNDGFTTKLYTSSNASDWSAPQGVSGLPPMCHVRNILLAGGTFLYADGDRLYRSTDAMSWSADDYSAEPFRLINTLYIFNDSVWCIAQRRSDNKLQFAAAGFDDSRFALTGDTLPDRFPISDFGAEVFATSSLRPRAMIIGGYDLRGQALNTRWNIEFLENRGYRMTDFTIEQPQYSPLVGASVVWYNHEFHLFGGSNAAAEIDSITQLVSTDEGLTWELPDSTKNKLPSSYRPRQKTTVIVDDKHYIYIFGGQDRTTTFSDVWRGRLNKTTFSDYED
ncbi:MAG: hypothetical protein IJS13_01270 [Paludibacteraceae bacterium]|nr:hypothetical protein [Paludibacteraceae bacterium]